MTSPVRHLLAAATPAPWAFRRNPGRDEYRGEFRAPDPHNGFMLVQAFTNDADAALIVNLVNLAAMREDVIDAAREIVEQPDVDGRCGPLRAALARLDAQQAEESA